MHTERFQLLLDPKFWWSFIYNKSQYIYQVLYVKEVFHKLGVSMKY
jgi:hypothetical protein